MKVEKVIDGLVAHARPTIRDVFGVKSCIPATKVVIGVLAHYGHKALPLPVEAFIASGPFADHLRAGGEWPSSPQQWELLGQMMWAMVIGGDPRKFTRRGEAFEPSPPGGEMWDGHLVAWVPDGKRYGWLVDASLDQAKRLAAGVDLPAVFALQVSREFRKGGPERKISMRCGDRGPVVQYHARPDNTEGYRTSPLWAECDVVIGRVTREVIRLIEGAPATAGSLARARSMALGAQITGSRL